MNFDLTREGVPATTIVMTTATTAPISTATTVPSATTRSNVPGRLKLASSRVLVLIHLKMCFIGHEL